MKIIASVRACQRCGESKVVICFEIAIAGIPSLAAEFGSTPKICRSPFKPQP
jgi:hypothetical protein